MDSWFLVHVCGEWTLEEWCDSLLATRALTLFFYIVIYSVPLLCAAYYIEQYFKLLKVAYRSVEHYLNSFGNIDPDQLRVIAAGQVGVVAPGVGSPQAADYPVGSSSTGVSGGVGTYQLQQQQQQQQQSPGDAYYPSQSHTQPSTQVSSVKVPPEAV